MRQYALRGKVDTAGVGVAYCYRPNINDKTFSNIFACLSKSTLPTP